MATEMILCRLCGTECSAKHSWSLTSDLSIKNRLLQRFQCLLDVRIELKDGLSTQVCRQCKRKLETLERAAEDLEKFKLMVRDVNASIHTRRHLKRHKESSGVVNISPDTSRLRPAPKRQLSRKQLDFSGNNNTIINNKTIIMILLLHRRYFEFVNTVTCCSSFYNTCVHEFY